MTRIALIYGGLAGLITIGTIIISFALSDGSVDSSDQVVGYLVMIVALSLIFFGIKRQRDVHNGGVIKFGAAFLTGISITVVASVVYVVCWEIYLAVTDMAFARDYAAAVIETKKAEGLSGAALQAEIDTMNKFIEDYKNPLFRIPVTFLEIFPVGLIITLISAAVLRNPKVLPAKHGGSKL